MKKFFHRLLSNKFVGYAISGFMMIFLGIPPVEAEDYYEAQKK